MYQISGLYRFLLKENTRILINITGGLYIAIFSVRWFLQDLEQIHRIKVLYQLKKINHKDFKTNTKQFKTEKRLALQNNCGEKYASQKLTQS